MKPYKFLLLLLVLLFSSASFAEEVNSLYTQDIKETTGCTEVTLPIFLNNTVSITGVQFDLYLPEGVEVAYTTNRNGDKSYASTITKGKDRFISDTNHSISCLSLQDGVMRIILSSFTNQTLVDYDLRGNDVRATSPMMNIKLNLPKDMNAGTYEVEIRNIVLSNYVNQETTKYVAENSKATIVMNGKSSVTFIVDDEIVSTGEFPWGDEIVVPDVADREGYTFAGWQDVDKVVPDHDITYRSSYNINSYWLRYLMDGEEYLSEVLEFGSPINPLDNPIKEGHTFSGWSEIPSNMPAHDVDITGYFTVNQYKVTFIIDEQDIKEETLDFGSVIIAPNNPAKTGHTFVGWSPDVDETVPNHDVVYTAQWNVNQYTITFDTDGGSVIDSITLDYGTPIETPASPSKLGFTFIGWDTAIPDAMPAENLTVKALWSINSYTVTYIVDEVEYMVSAYTYNEMIMPAVEPTKEGYTFSGWDVIPETMPAENIIVTGSFAINRYCLSFVVDNDTIYSQRIEFDSEIIVPSSPEKEGFTFAGWSEVPATMPAKDLTITGTFNINQYLVRFETTEGETIAELILDYGSKIIVPEVPEKEGYDFVGWTPEVAETVPANDVTYVANYTKRVILIGSITFKEESYCITEGDTIELNYTINPEDADNKDLVWTSSDESIALVENGIVTAIKHGEVIITAKATDDSNVFAQCIVTVIEPSGISGINNMQNIDGIYTIDGKKILRLQKGVNILRRKDGSVKKVAKRFT